MVAWMIEDIRQFTSKLFVGEVFDRFLVREVNIVTFNSFTIDGHIRTGYYTEGELGESRIESLSSWKTLRPICFSLIRGKKLPGSFRIELQLPPAETLKFLAGRALQFKAEEVQGLNLGIRYEDGRLLCVTGTSLGVFTMDKSLDHEWDGAAFRFLQKNGIDCVEA